MARADLAEMDSLGPRDARWPWAAGLGLLALFGWSAFVRGARVPLLGWIDLAIHEAGHVLTMPLPEIVMMAMGSGFQVLVPLSLAAVFAFRERDRLGAAVCLGWGATSLQDASVYIGDAPYQRLPLIGGQHDWAFVLGRLDALEQAAALARLVWTVGLLTLLVAFALCGWGLITRAPRGAPAKASMADWAASTATLEQDADEDADRVPGPPRSAATDEYFASAPPPRRGDQAG